MIKLYINSINKTIDIKHGLYQIIIENPNLYRNIAINIEDEITLSIDEKIISFEKSTSVFYDPFNIDLNDSKNVKSLYKVLEKELHNSLVSELNDIENVFYDIVEKLIISSNMNIDYESQIDISKLLACFGIKYTIYEDYMLNLIQLIKIQYELLSKKIVFFFGLSTVLNNNEINMLNTELLKNGLSVIDISFYPKIIDSVNYLIIDEDFCIL